MYNEQKSKIRTGYRTCIGNTNDLLLFKYESNDKLFKKLLLISSRAHFAT